MKKTHIVAFWICSILIWNCIPVFAQMTRKENKVVSAQIIASNCTPLLELNQKKVIVKSQKMADSLICDFINNGSDTIYLYGTTYSEKFMYNKTMIERIGKKSIVDLSEKVPHPFTYTSGMKQYQFYIIPPNCSLKFVLSITEISNALDQKKITDILVKFSYYERFNIYDRTDNVITGWLGRKKDVLSSY